MAYSIQVTFDALDPAALSGFWAAALGYNIQPPPPEYESWDDWATAMGIPEENRNDARALVDPDGIGPRLFFQRVPEPKTAKNRVHLDVNAGGGHDADPAARIQAVNTHIAKLEQLGARKTAVFEQRGEYWVVMQDPEGNEFCVQ